MPTPAMGYPTPANNIPVSTYPQRLTDSNTAIEADVNMKFDNNAARQAVITYNGASGTLAAKAGMVTYLRSPGRWDYCAGISGTQVVWKPLILGVTTPVTTSVLKGAAWDGVSQVLDYAFSSVVAIGNTVGGFNVALPVAAVNGLLTAVMVVGDSNGQTMLMVNPNAAFHTLGSLSGNAFQMPPGGALQYMGQGSQVRVECRVVLW